MIAPPIALTMGKEGTAASLCPDARFQTDFAR